IYSLIINVKKITKKCLQGIFFVV
ncbi:hypothetical protein A5844_001138, partial [Enterococcus sp. 10A9_DIV0425]